VETWTSNLSTEPQEMDSKHRISTQSAIHTSVHSQSSILTVETKFSEALSMELIGLLQVITNQLLKLSYSQSLIKWNILSNHQQTCMLLWPINHMDLLMEVVMISCFVIIAILWIQAIQTLDILMICKEKWRNHCVGLTISLWKIMRFIRWLIVEIMITKKRTSNKQKKEERKNKNEFRGGELV